MQHNLSFTHVSFLFSFAQRKEIIFLLFGIVNQQFSAVMLLVIFHSINQFDISYVIICSEYTPYNEIYLLFLLLW